MLWEYIKDNYEPGELILTADIALDISATNQRQQFKYLTDTGKLRRYENGVYYMPKKTRLGTEMAILVDDVMECKFITRKQRTFGYYSGFTFANQVGITTQMPAIKEIITSEMQTAIKQYKKGERLFVIRKAYTEVTDENCKVLQLLDLLKDIEQYTEVECTERTKCLTEYIRRFNITRDAIDRYLPYYPQKIYKAIYETRIMDVFTQ